MLQRVVVVLLIAGAGWAEVGSVPSVDDPPVVRTTATWNDLPAQPAITCADGTRVHLGIELAAAPASRGALVYLLGEGGPVVREYFGSGPLGPLSRQRAGGPILFCNRATQVRGDRGENLRLWTLRVTADAGATASWLVRDQERVVAIINFTATAETWHAWSPLVIEPQHLLQQLKRQADPPEENATTGGHAAGVMA